MLCKEDEFMCSTSPETGRTLNGFFAIGDPRFEPGPNHFLFVARDQLHDDGRSSFLHKSAASEVLSYSPTSIVIHYAT